MTTLAALPTTVDPTNLQEIDSDGYSVGPYFTTGAVDLYTNSSLARRTPRMPST